MLGSEWYCHSVLDTPIAVLMHPCNNADARACTAVSDGDRVALTSMKFESDKSAGTPVPHLPELDHKSSLPLAFWMAAMHSFCGTSRAPMLSQFMPSQVLRALVCQQLTRMATWSRQALMLISKPDHSNYATAHRCCY